MGTDKTIRVQAPVTGLLDVSSLCSPGDADGAEWRELSPPGDGPALAASASPSGCEAHTHLPPPSRTPAPGPQERNRESGLARNQPAHRHQHTLPASPAGFQALLLSPRRLEKHQPLRFPWGATRVTVAGPRRHPTWDGGWGDSARWRRETGSGKDRHPQTVFKHQI